jgi:hypothetical protein
MDEFEWSGETTAVGVERLFLGDDMFSFSLESTFIKTTSFKRVSTGMVIGEE